MSSISPSSEKKERERERISNYVGRYYMRIYIAELVVSFEAYKVADNQFEVVLKA